MAKKAIAKSAKSVEALKHDEAKRRNIPTAEYQSVMQKNEQDPVRVAYGRRPGDLGEEIGSRNTDLDPQLVWRGKDEQDWSDLVVHAPPLYIQEKVHPKALIDDLLRESKHPSPAGRGVGGEGDQLDLFADFNGISPEADKTEFYRHDQNWSNRMILGDSLQVMASLAEREGPAREGAVHLLRSALRHPIQQQFPVEHDEPGREGRQRGAHHARARAGEGVPGYVARRHSLIPYLPARPADGGARSADRERFDLRADRG
jgi:hypothetical protein